MTPRIHEQTSMRTSSPQGLAKEHRGFTLVELMITLTVLAVVMVVLMSVMYAAQRSKTSTSNNIESAQAARAALDMMSRDLRSAGYCADLFYAASPQPPIAYIDSMQVLINANFSPWPDDTVPLSPLAYNPAGNPKPFPLNATPWQPPIKYRRGAEIVRWTLDVNNDGQVNAADVAAAEGVDAQHTPNPNDFVLVRQIYGDSTGNIAGNNGGQMEHIALIRKPGGTVPPMFRVYLQGQSTFWDWSNGPLPTSKLADIQRITVSVVSPSSRPDSRGNYAETRLSTDVNSLRNVPNSGRKEYPVDGYVFQDLPTWNGTKEVGEPGLAGATVRLGAYSATTNAAGYFMFRVPAGTYVIKHVPPSGYGVLTSPDSATLNIAGAAGFSFADTARSGGFVDAFVYDDKYANATFDGSDTPLSGVKVAISPTSEEVYTDDTGRARLFAPVGTYSVTVTPPDSFLATTTNPVSGSMTNGGSASYSFGLSRTEVGTITGTVFRDNDRDGVLDSGEVGIPNVWVGVTNDGGVTILAYEYTDPAGTYQLTVPINKPPGTTPYQIITIVPSGYYATGTTSIAPVWVQAGDLIKNQDFGMLGYQIITLNASRVLSLSSGDLVEKIGADNGGNNARRDADLVLGADAGGTDNVSIWYNDYDNSPVFVPTPSYTRNAPQSVLSLTLDTLDTASPKARLDLVTGTKNALAGNFFVWFNQNSGGNEGYFPLTYDRAYRTANNGDVQSVLTADVSGGIGADQADIIVGSKSATANQGSIEIWTSSNAASPTFSRLETYPGAGGVTSLGEVNVMALADFNNDGRRDLVVGTRTGDFTGQLLFLRNNGKVLGTSRFTLVASYDPGGIVTALTPVKADFDSLTDVIVGIQTGLGSGELQQWTNTLLSGVMSFSKDRTVAAPGLVMSLCSADFGGLATHNDFAMGWRQNTTSFVGGVKIYPLDTGRLINNDIDPSAGSITNMVPALSVNNFNYGIQPVTPIGPYLMDLAAGVKISATTGALVVFIR
jgi:prepilin-type N-terminal cleavage/methylation domain-containing protein